jgi:hypothetical protein
MKTRVETPQAQTFGAGNIKKMSIKQDHKTFRAFSDGLYADKISSIIRELASNAVDAQRNAKTLHIPYEIFLPCETNSKFSIRDYGTGLSPKQIDDIYAIYGESTKENDNENIGGFGLGSKTPFAYSDQFFVRSYFNGRVYTYTFYFDKDEPAYLQVGDCETDEPNGLEIYFDVDDDDFKEFENKAKRTLLWLEIVPNIWASSSEENGFFKQKESANLKDSWIVEHQSSILLDHELFSICNHNYLNHINFNQGGVVYSLGSNSIDDFPSLAILKNSLNDYNLRLILKCDIGTLELARSRETLSLSKKVTIPSLHKMGDALIELAKMEMLRAIKDTSQSSFTMNCFLNNVIGAKKMNSTENKTIGDNSYSNFFLLIAKAVMERDNESFDFPFEKKSNFVELVGDEFSESELVSVKFLHFDKSKWKSLRKGHFHNGINVSRFSQEKVHVVCKDEKVFSASFLANNFAGSNSNERVVLFDIKKELLAVGQTKKEYFIKEVLPNIYSFYGANPEDLNVQYTSDIKLDKLSQSGSTGFRNKFTFFYSQKHEKDYNKCNNSEYFKGKNILVIKKKSNDVTIAGTDCNKDEGFKIAHRLAFVANENYDCIVSVNSRELDAIIVSGGKVTHIDNVIKKLKNKTINPVISEYFETSAKKKFYLESTDISDQSAVISSLYHFAFNKKDIIASKLEEKNIAFKEHDEKTSTLKNLCVAPMVGGSQIGYFGLHENIKNILLTVNGFTGIEFDINLDTCSSFWGFKMPEQFDLQPLMTSILAKYTLANHITIPQKDSDNYCLFESSMVEYISQVGDLTESPCRNKIKLTKCA